MVKKGIALCAAVVMLLCTVNAAFASYMYIYSRNGKPVNLRERYTGRILTSLPFGREVYVDDEESDDTVAVVSYEEYYGTIPWTYLSKTKEQSPSTPGTLKVGSKGDAVQKLQKMLLELGFLNDKADGVFGKKTEVGLNAYYKYTGWDQKGYATPLDQSRLSEFYAYIMGTVHTPGLDTLRDEASCVPENGYCYRHKQVTKLYDMLTDSKGTPQLMKEQVLRRICDFWESEINDMYDAWAKQDKETAEAQRKLFKSSWKKVKGEKKKTELLTLTAQAAWINANGMNLCYDLYGKTN